MSLRVKLGLISSSWMKSSQALQERETAFCYCCCFDGERRAAVEVEVVEGVDTAYLLELASELLDLLGSVGVIGSFVRSLRSSRAAA